MEPKSRVNEASKSQLKQSPIGVFDSGLGGLTVLAAIKARLPNEELVYLGDTARVPYGTKSAETVIRYALSCASFLAAENVKAIVIACNTVSAVALPELYMKFGQTREGGYQPIPVLGVVEPGARRALAVSRTKKIGVLATAGTVRSSAYRRAILSLSADAEVIEVAAPLLVPLAEEGWLAGEVPTKVIERYLEPILAADVDTLVLGCTHYPMFAKLFREILSNKGRQIELVDSAQTTADFLADLLTEQSLLRDSGTAPNLRLCVTDRSPAFEQVAAVFLNPTPVPGLEHIDLQIVK